MIEKAVARRIDESVGELEDPMDWDVELIRQDLLMRYLLSVPCFEESGTRPKSGADAAAEGSTAGREAFHRKLTLLGEYADQVLALVMLNVLDEKWKDHLYDLDQLRNAIHYRSWGQKDPLIEYKHEAYTMFVDLMHDVHHTFSERFLRVQVQFDGDRGFVQPAAPPRQVTATHAQVDEFGVAADPAMGEIEDAVGPSRPEPTIVGAGRGVRSLAAGGGGAAGVPDFSTVSRNDLCPCGSGKKFKKCHGA